MAATDKAQDAPEKETQGESMPDSDQKSSGDTDSQQVADKGQEASGASMDDSEGTLPDGAKERTKKEFNKLKEQLRQYRDAYLREVQNKSANQTQQDQGADDDQPLYDPETGLVNLEALQKLQREAREARQEAREVSQTQKQYIQDREARELYEAHPEIEENEELFSEAERIWLHSQAYPERYDGRQLSQKEAADLAKKRLGNTKDSDKDQERSEEELAGKEQASLEASGRPTQGVQQKVSSEEELERLRQGTRLGDDQAMIARLRKIREAKSEAEK